VQLAGLEKSNPARASLEKTGAIVLAETWNQAWEFVNRFGAEHLSVPDENGEEAGRCRAAGTVFAGGWAAQPLGDYASGSNHVLPTGGWARRRGGLSAADFVKCISVQRIGREGFQRLAEDVQTLARAEGLEGHAQAVSVRR